jgi:hypothetical protein
VFLCYNFSAMKTLVAVVFLVLFPTLVPMPGKAVQQQDAQKHSEAENPRAKEQPASQRPAGNTQNKETNAAQNPQGGDHYEATSDKQEPITVKPVSITKDSWDMAYIAATIAIALVTLVLAGIARTQAQTAKKSADAIVNAERAWVTASPVELKPPLIYIPTAGDAPTPQARNVFAVYIKNFGKTPARISRSALVYEKIPSFDRLPTAPNYKNVTVHEGWIFVPGGEPFGHLAFLSPDSILTEPEAQAVANKETLLYAYGFVEYRCVFDCAECPHESRFGYVYNFPQGGEPQMLKGFKPGGPEAYNRVT